MDLGETLQYLVFLAFVFLLLLLRLDARRFGAAEYDDEVDPNGSNWRAWLRRLTWYSLGLGLILIAYRLYQAPITQLHLGIGSNREQALILGLAAGALGTSAAFAFAWLRYRRFRLPPARHYFGGAINAVGTAIIDEALFRGMVLGLLLASDWPPLLAVVFQTALYALVTRLGAPGRSRSMLLISSGIGLVGGYLVVQTAGVMAAILGHAVTRFAIFLATGHAGQVRPQGWEPEEEAAYGLPPQGWEFYGDEEEPGPNWQRAQPG